VCAVALFVCVLLCLRLQRRGVGAAPTGASVLRPARDLLLIDPLLCAVRLVSVCLCVCAEAWGGRSANRGQCAQACRMPYGLIVDGVLKVRTFLALVSGAATYTLNSHCKCTCIVGLRSCKCTFDSHFKCRQPRHVTATANALDIKCL
jgi:hypothetical protein